MILKADDQGLIVLCAILFYQTKIINIPTYYLYEFTFRSYPHQKQRTTTCCFIQLQLSVVSSDEDDLEVEEGAETSTDRPGNSSSPLLHLFGEVRRTEERQAFGFKWHHGRTTLATSLLLLLLLLLLSVVSKYVAIESYLMNVNLSARHTLVNFKAKRCISYIWGILKDLKICWLLTFLLILLLHKIELV